MICPKCGHNSDKVIDSRQSRNGAAIRRRRECVNCNFRYTTYETVERMEFHVIKRDGRREPFDRRKIRNGIGIACEKRPIGPEAIEQLVDEILIALESLCEPEIPTPTIGALVMQRLHALDPVAYVRYASVYRQFADVGEFIDEIRSLESRIRPNSLQAELFTPPAPPSNGKN